MRHPGFIGNRYATLVKKAPDTPIMQFSQVGQWPSFGLKEIESHVKAGEMLYDGNPVTTWMLGNCSVIINRSGYMVPDRTNPDLKIDGVDALINAVCIEAHVKAKPEEDKPGFGVQVVDWSKV